MFALLVVASLGVGGWFGWQAVRGDGKGDTAHSLRPCIEPTHPPAPSGSRDVRLRVLNGTNRAGLAHDVATQLRARGFRLAGVGNNPRRLAATTVEYPDGALAAAEAVSEQLRDAQLEAGRVRVVTLILGRDFHRLASVPEASARRAADTQRAHPTPSPCPSATA